MKSILLACAVDAELRALQARANVTQLTTGVGPVEAALSTARALSERSYDVVINAGIGGAFHGRADLGDSVAIFEEHYVELGLEAGGPLMLPEGSTLHTQVESDERLVALYRSRQLAARLGRGATSATITTTDARAAKLRARLDCDVESMEGFAVLQAARTAGVRAIELRGISNIVGDRAKSRWDFQAGMRAAVRAVDALLDALADDRA